MVARRVVVHRAGDSTRLQIEEHPAPTPGPGEVLVEVAAVGINYADVVVRMGLYSSAKEYVGWPITPGFEVAGRVAGLGDGVEGLTLGQEVLAVTRFGGYTTALVAPAHQVLPIPLGWSFEQAAGFPAVFLTAYHALFELAHPRPGSTMLVHSAAGGVGGALCQLGRIAQCRVVGVVGASHKVESALAGGCDDVIDKSVEPLWERAAECAPGGYDVVLDANGVSTLRESFNHLKPTGRLVVYGFASMLPRGRGRPNWIKLAWDYLRTPRFNPLEMTTANKSVLAFNLSYLFEQEEIFVHAMETLLGWVSDGAIHPPPVTPFAFDEVAAAHRSLESGATIGKLVLTVAGGTDEDGGR